MLGVPRTGAEMAHERRPFEPDADNTAVGKHDKKNPLQILLSGPLSFVEAGFSFGEAHMEIQLNGKRIAVADDMTIGELVRKKDLDPAALVVEHNLTIIPADDWDAVRLKEKDVVEILRFVGGG